MKLAQALIERADLQRKLAQLGARLQQNAQYQEGEAPAEDPQDLLTDYPVSHRFHIPLSLYTR